MNAPTVKIIPTNGFGSNHPNNMKPMPSIVLIVGPIAPEMPCSFLVKYWLSGITNNPGKMNLMGEIIVTTVISNPIFVNT